MLRDRVLDDIGVAAGLATVASFAIKTEGKPNYIAGALVGIPAALLVAPIVPNFIAAPVGGAYIGALVGYGLATFAKASTKTTERVAAGLAVLGAVLSYL